MALYEHIFMARQDISAQQVEELTAHFKGVLEENGATIGRTESWGLKSLQYRINKNRKAHYVLMDVDGPGAAIHELERQMRIHEDILRYMTVKVDAHEEGPSAMMKRGDRDSRGPREDRGPRENRAPREDKGEDKS